MRDRRGKCGKVGKRGTENVCMGEVGGSRDQMFSGYRCQLYVINWPTLQELGLETEMKPETLKVVSYNGEKAGIKEK